MENNVGVFLGSFNPPHIGHEHIIVNAWNSNIFSKIYIIPAYQNPWKQIANGYPTYDERYEMCCEMFGALNENIIVSDFERQFAKNNNVETVFTYEMLKEFEKNIDCKVNIITTAETFCEIYDWHNGIDMLHEFKYFIIKDKNSDWLKFSSYVAELQNMINDKYYELNNMQYELVPCDDVIINVSSTKLRELFKNIYKINIYNKPIIPHYTNDNVIKYILNNYIYDNLR